MKTLLFVLVTSTLLAQNQPAVSNSKAETRAYSGDLSSEIRSQAPTWFGYAVKTMRGDHQNCCWNNSVQCGCRLEGGSSGTFVSGSQPQGAVQLEGPVAIAVLFRVANNVVEKVQVYSLSCPLDAGAVPFVWLTGVPAVASIAYLEKLATGNATEHVTDGAILAISEHDDPQADKVLGRLAMPPESDRVREKSIFWLGANRGAAGVPILKSLFANDASEHIRDKVVFALSISSGQPAALETLIAAAKSDPSPHIRGQALFWLSQKAGKRAASAISDAIENDPDTQVKERAVFALSQLPKDEGVPKLIEVARSQKNPEVRKKAFFWLGQSGDPRALAFIEQVLVN
jgi:HEAT repeat protein